MYKILCIIIGSYNYYNMVMVFAVHTAQHANTHKRKLKIY